MALLDSDIFPHALQKIKVEIASLQQLPDTIQ